MGVDFSRDPGTPPRLALKKRFYDELVVVKILSEGLTNQSSLPSVSQPVVIQARPWRVGCGHAWDDELGNIAMCEPPPSLEVRSLASVPTSLASSVLGGCQSLCWRRAQQI